MPPSSNMGSRSWANKNGVVNCRLTNDHSIFIFSCDMLFSPILVAILSIKASDLVHFPFTQFEIKYIVVFCNMLRIG